MTLLLSSIIHRCLSSTCSSFCLHLQCQRLWHFQWRGLLFSENICITGTPTNVSRHPFPIYFLVFTYRLFTWCRTNRWALNVTPCSCAFRSACRSADKESAYCSGQFSTLKWPSSSRRSIAFHSCSLLAFCSTWIPSLRTFSRMTYLSFMRYGFEGSMLSIYGYDRPLFTYSTSYCPDRYPYKFLEQFNMAESSYYWSLLDMLVFFLAVRATAYFALSFKLESMRWTLILSPLCQFYFVTIIVFLFKYCCLTQHFRQHS